LKFINKINFFSSLKNFCAIIGFLFFVPGVFAAVPIQGISLSGAGAAQARLKVLAAAESFLGTPYRYAGIDRKGLDCSGLVYLSFRVGLKFTVPRTTNGLYSWVERIAATDLQIGDLVFFATTGPGVSHVGIYAGDGRFIHSASDGPHTGVIYSRLNEPYWRRTYLGAGRALPWDDEAAQAMIAAVNAARAGSTAGGVQVAEAPPDHNTPNYDNPGVNTNAVASVASPVWSDPGFYAGFGAAWTWGGFIEGSPDIFRGISAQAAIGYKWAVYRLGLELRPEWDRALGVFRLPLTVAFGTDIFQVFAGPAYTTGDPRLVLKNVTRYYSGGGAWLGELGLSAAFPPIKISRGALSFFGELAWQPYQWQNGDFDFNPDVTANLRLSTGVRYLWRLGE